MNNMNEYPNNLFGFLPPIELSLEIESIKRGPVKTLQYYVAFLKD